MNLYYESDPALLSALLILSLWQYVTDKRFNTEWKAFCLWLDTLNIHLFMDMDHYSHAMRILVANKGSSFADWKLWRGTTRTMW